MSIKDKLQIILITYNRRVLLERTLKQLAADNSPIKDCEITVLDNASTDGTKELCENFCNQHSNFIYKRNPKNVGLSGNIIKAMELASKKWLWILCDDDSFRWDAWSEIESALQEDYDLVFTRKNPIKCDYSHLINDSAFLPNVIFNTKHITSTTLINAYGIAHTLCPHHAITCKVINENGKMFTPDSPFEIVMAGNNDVDNKDYLKVKNDDLYFKFANYNILQGYINSYMLIKDEKVRHECMDVLCQGLTFKQSMNGFLHFNPEGDLVQIFELLANADKRQIEDFIDILISSSNLAKEKYIKFILSNTVLISKNILNKYRRLIICVSFHDNDIIIKLFGINIKIKKWWKKCQ